MLPITNVIAKSQRLSRQNMVSAQGKPYNYTDTAYEKYRPQKMAKKLNLLMQKR